MKINKVDLFRKYLNALQVNYIEPCTNQAICFGQNAHNISITGKPCPLTYPLLYNNNTFNNEADFVSQVEIDYPTFSITFNSSSCIFTFIGLDIPPLNIIIA